MQGSSVVSARHGRRSVSRVFDWRCCRRRRRAAKDTTRRFAGKNVSTVRPRPHPDHTATANNRVSLSAATSRIKRAEAQDLEVEPER
jgi:hypothetical protein